MNAFKKISIRVLYLSLFVLALSLIYKRYFFEDFLKKEGILLYRLQRSINADYLFFSASSDYTFDPINDKDTTRVSILAMNYCNKSIKSIADGAHHAGVFKELIKHIPENSMEGIIVALNMRSFSPEWLTDENENALQKYAAIYRPLPPLIARMNVAFKNYPIKSKIELNQELDNYFSNWKIPLPPPKNTIENWCAVEKYGDWKNEKRQLADHYIKSYGFIIHEDHPRVKNFDEIVKIASKKKLKLIFHILPENVQEAQSLIGSDLLNLMKRNRDYLLNRYHKPDQQVWVIDNLSKVAHENFTDKDFPTEHYNEKGRTIIAKSIAEKINQIK